MVKIRRRIAAAAIVMIIVAAACSVPDLDLSNSPCPCLDGYQCDVSTNRCVASTSDASVSDAQNPVNDSGSDTSVLVTPDGAPETLLFDEEFDGGTLDLADKWTALGNGAWSIQNGHGEQTNPHATLSLIYATHFTTAANYHISTRMHSTGPFDAGLDLAPEIIFRVNPEVDAGGGNIEIYQCDFDLPGLELDLLWVTPTGDQYVDREAVTVPANFDVATPFVLDAIVNNDAVNCSLTIDGVAAVTHALSTGLIAPVGSFGLKSYTTDVEYEYFRVNALP